MDVTMTAGSKKAASHKRQTDGGISGKSIVGNAAATHGSPECNPSRSESTLFESAEAFPKSNEQFSSVLPSE